MKKSEFAGDPIEEINADVAQLIEHIRRSTAPEHILNSCTEHIRSAVAMLDPWLHEGAYSSAILDPNSDEFYYKEQDLTRSMPYSPISGRKNPISPPMKMWLVGDKVEGVVYFSSPYAGPPDCVHGGIIAGVFDELLSLANIANKIAGFTGSLTIKYHRPTPLHCKINLSAECVRVSGRKVLSRGEMRADGILTASAEGLFIKPAEEKAEAPGND